MSKKILALFFTLIFLCSCVETVVVGTVASGVIVAKSNKESKTESNTTKDEPAKDDEETKKSIKKAFKEEDSSAYRNIKITVFKGRILLSGYVRETKYKQTAATKASAAQPNNEIINEIIVLDLNENISALNDYFISKKISVRLNKLKDIDLSDYKYSITNSIVIVMGKSQNKSQMDEITQIISTTKGVKKVINYIQY